MLLLLFACHHELIEALFLVFLLSLFLPVTPAEHFPSLLKQRSFCSDAIATSRLHTEASVVISVVSSSSTPTHDMRVTIKQGGDLVLPKIILPVIWFLPRTTRNRQAMM